MSCSQLLCATSLAAPSLYGSVLLMCYGFNSRRLVEAGPDCPMRGGWWGHGGIAEPGRGVAALVAQGLPAGRIILSVSWSAKRYTCDGSGASPTNCSVGGGAQPTNAYLFQVAGLDGSRCAHAWEPTSATAYVT